MFIVSTLFALASIAVMSLVDHAGLRLVIVVVLGTIAYHAAARALVNAADARADKRRRARRTGAALLLAATILPACRPQPVNTPEPAAIASLDCGARACSITTAGSSALIWINE